MSRKRLAYVVILGTIIWFALFYNTVHVDPERESMAQNNAAVQVESQWNRFETVPDVPATIRIPRLGQEWVRTIREGVSEAQLNAGVGHYPQTNNVGERGNYGLAAHRTGHGDALYNVDKLVKGDEISVRTATKTYTYVVQCHVIVSPETVSVLDPVPNAGCATKSGRWLTLTTCEPKYINTERWIVFASLKETL